MNGLQEAGTSPSNEIKRIGACLSVLFGLCEKIRTSGLGADFPRLRSGGRPLSDFQTIHRMVWIANNATARKSPGRTAVAGNRLPPVDLLFEHPPDVQNGEIRHRKSTPLRLQEAGTSPSNEIKRIGVCLSVLFGLGEKIRTSGLGADFPSHTLGRPPVVRLPNHPPDGLDRKQCDRKEGPGADCCCRQQTAAR